MKKKLLFVLVMSALLILSLLAACAAPPPVEQPTTPPPLPPKDKIVIGWPTSLSGPYALGVQITNGPIYDLWVKDVNADGGIMVKEYGKKLPVELLTYDDKSDIGIMTKLLEKLILDDKVDFILPPWGTAMLFASAPIANRYGYILIGGPGGAEKLKQIISSLPYFFSVLNFSDTQMPALADILVELNAKKAAIMFIDDLHGIEYSGVAVTEFAKRGIDIAMVKNYPYDIKDMSTILKQAKALDVDAFCGFSYPDDSMLCTGQALSLGINFKVFELSVGPPFSFYKNAFGEQAVEGVIGTGAWNAKSTPKAAAFVDHFTQVEGPDVNWWGGLFFYASLEHFKQAVEEAGTLNQQKIRDIMATAHYDTVCGDYWYENQFFVNHPGEIGQWQKGVFEVIDPGKKRTAPPEIKPDWPKQ